jgi:hypothetical protein
MAINDPLRVELPSYSGIAPIDGDGVGSQGMNKLLGCIAERRGVLHGYRKLAFALKSEFVEGSLLA